MELEHLFQQPNIVMTLQMIFAGALLTPAAAGRPELYRRFVNTAAAAVVNAGPMGLLVYMLYEVSRLS